MTVWAKLGPIRLVLMAAGAVTLAATAVGLLLRVYAGLFGYRETLAVPYAETSLVVEFTGAAVLLAAALLLLTRAVASGWLTGLLGGPPRRSPGLVPPERKCDRDGDEEPAGAGEPGGDIGALVDDRDGAGQVAEGILELVSLLSAVVLAPGSGGDLSERILVNA